MPTKPPHLDAPPCPTCAGPLVPLDGSTADPRDDDTRPLAIACAACGDRWDLDLTNAEDLRTFARIWWSAGAWAGKQHTEENRK